MIRICMLMATTLIATSSLALATEPAKTLPPLSPTKDKSAQTQTTTPESKSPERILERAREDSRRKGMKATIRTQERSATKAAPTSTGTKGQAHAPSKAVQHESAKDPANQKAPATPGPNDAPYGN